MISGPLGSDGDRINGTSGRQNGTAIRGDGVLASHNGDLQSSNGATIDANDAFTWLSRAATPRNISRDTTPGDPASRPYIKSVHMENFMCHTNFKIDLIRRVNLICGSNGSGKSTILVALMVALGSKAKNTSRGDSLAQLVKKGKSRAYIHVKLNVPPEYEELYDKYGDEVTVTRVITNKNTSRYELRDNEGRVVRGAGAKDIRNICNQFGIYPDNELAMLSQENAKDFLVHVVAQKKYEKLHKALLQHMIGLNQRVVKSTTEHQQILIDQMKLREQHYEEMERVAENVLENASLHHSKRKRLDDIYTVLDWRDFQEVQERKTEADKAVNIARQELEELEQSLTVEDQRAELSRQIDDLELQRTAIDVKMEETREQLVSARRELEDCEELVARVDEDIEKFDEQYTRFGRETKEVEQKAAQHSPEQLEARRQSLEKKQSLARDKKDQLIEQRNDLERQTNEATAQRDAIKLTMKPMLEERTEKLTMLRQLKADLEDQTNLRNGESSRNPPTPRGPRGRAGNNSEGHQKLKELVAKFQNWKSGPPVGPLYSYIEVKDEGSEYTPALERLWGGTLESWWVRSPEDRDQLMRLADRVRPGFSINILVRQDDRYTFDRELPEKSGEYIRVVDVLEVSLEPVLRILVDQNRIEKLVLAPTLNGAFAISDRQNIRDVLALAQSRHGETNFQMITKVESRRDTTFITPSNLSLLKVGNEARRRLLRREIRDSQLQVDALEQQITEEKHRLQSAQDSLDNYKRLLADVDNQIRDTEASMENITAEIARIETDFSDQDFATDIENLRKARKRARINFNGAKDTRVELVEDLQKAEALVDALSQTLSDSQSEYRRNKVEIDDLQRSLHRLERQNSELSRRIETKRARIPVAEAGARTAQVEYDDALNEYVNKHGDMQTQEELASQNEYFSKSARFLEEEIAKLTSEQSVVRTTLEEVQNAERDLETARRNKEAAIARRQDMERSKALVIVGQSQRAENERRVWEDIKSSIQEHFRGILSLRNYIGEVSIDDKRKTLVASASPDARSAQGTETLSGGEKSLTQIALLMSVWQTMDLGLVAMDEYDVFMDKVNRSTSLRCIGETAESAQLQCIIITPQDVDTSALDGVEHIVRRLNPAR